MTFDFSELTAFKQDMLKTAEVLMPNQSKKFLKKSATKLAKIQKKIAQGLLKKKTGRYLKSFKSGKVYNFEGDLCARAYNSSPTAHLHEYGHNIVTQKKNGKQKVGFVEGKYVMKKAQESFKEVFYKDCEVFIDEVLDGGLNLR